MLVNCLQKCRWTVFKSVDELSPKNVSVNCLVGELSCSPFYGIQANSADASECDVKCLGKNIRLFRVP